MSWMPRLLLVSPLLVSLVLVVACGGDGAGTPPPAGDDPGGGGGGGGPSSRLHPADLTYRGAFLLPPAFDYGARGLSHVPESGGRGSLLVTGPEVPPASFGRVAVPEPVITADWKLLPTAVLESPVTSFDGDLIETALDADTTYGGAIEYVPAQGTQTTDKIYGAADWWYAVSGETFPTIWFAEMDGSSPRGLFHVGPHTAPHHGNRIGDYLFRVPRWYADAHLGGRWLVAGKTRGAFGGSMGPTLFAFRPWESDDPSGDLDAIGVLWYRERYPDCAGPNVGDKAACDFPDFTMCDKWLGGAFLESGARRAVVLGGVKGLGSNRYGPQEPDDCEQSQGYHCDPYERQVIFYDVDELAEAARGERDPWSVVPYEIWRPSELFLGSPTCGATGGMGLDVEGRRLFLVEKGLGENNSAAVHVWQVAP